MGHAVQEPDNPQAKSLIHEERRFKSRQKEEAATAFTSNFPISFITKEVREGGWLLDWV